jgi:hypothetical protein
MLNKALPKKQIMKRRGKHIRKKIVKTVHQCAIVDRAFFTI